MDLKNHIRTIPDFPKKGIMFRDVTTLMKNGESFKYTIDQLYEKYSGQKIDKIVGIESRGFIFGGALAYKLGIGFVPVRKPGKLPGEKVRVEYELEYGKDALEIHKDAILPGENVLIIDDLIATGGTCLAAISLVEKLNGNIVGCAFVVDLPELKGKEKLSNYQLFNLVEFEGH